MTASAATYPAVHVQVEQGHAPRGPRVGPRHQPGRAPGRGDDNVAEGGAQAIPGRLGHGFLPGPRDQEGARPAGRRGLGQHRPLGRGQHQARQRLRIAVPAQRVRAAVELLDVHPDGGLRDGDRDQVTRVRDRMLDAAALDDRLAVRLAALAAGPVEAHVRRALPGVAGQRGLRERAPGQETQCGPPRAGRPTSAAVRSHPAARRAGPRRPACAPTRRRRSRPAAGAGPPVQPPRQPNGRRPEPGSVCSRCC